MDRLKVLKLYLATRLHFTDKGYDIFKYKAAVRNCNETTLASNKSRRALIERLANRFDNPGQVMGYLVPQWIYSNGAALYEPIFAEENYLRWQKFKIGIKHFVTSDLSDYDIKEIIMGTEPAILKLIKQGNVQIESAIVLQKLYEFLDLKQDYFINSRLCSTIIKSAGFTILDKDELKMELDYAKT